MNGLSSPDERFFYGKFAGYRLPLIFFGEEFTCYKLFSVAQHLVNFYSTHQHNDE